MNRSVLRFRSVFVSDLHLGSTGCRAEQISEFLQSVESDALYLVGDVIDSWVLRQGDRWTDKHTEVLRHILGKEQAGTKVFYTPGNHDEVLKQMIGTALGNLRVERSFVHETAEGKRLLVTHGDEFDRLGTKYKKLAWVMANCYDEITRWNQKFNGFLAKVTRKQVDFSTGLKKRLKRTVKRKTGFEHNLLEHAIELGLDGVVCGHIHTPALTAVGELLYVNTGDWVEHATAVVEHLDGRLELVDWHDLQLRLSRKIEQGTLNLERES
ncbi:MAG: UDP-2,3-diacylglucosamine diphosphatase [Fimbriimonadaceae bacterium]|nr:UDP-2,3-diacylglucosamine diphosphatase [Fimbriimonadaceae bacterium]